MALTLQIQAGYLHGLVATRPVAAGPGKGKENQSASYQSKLLIPTQQNYHDQQQGNFT